MAERFYFVTEEINLRVDKAPESTKNPFLHRYRFDGNF